MPAPNAKNHPTRKPIGRNNISRMKTTLAQHPPSLHNLYIIAIYPAKKDAMRANTTNKSSAATHQDKYTISIKNETM